MWTEWKKVAWVLNQRLIIFFSWFISRFNISLFVVFSWVKQMRNRFFNSNFTNEKTLSKQQKKIDFFSFQSLASYMEVSRGKKRICLFWNFGALTWTIVWRLITAIWALWYAIADIIPGDTISGTTRKLPHATTWK